MTLVKIGHEQVDNAVSIGSIFNVNEGHVKQILRAAGVELPKKKETIFVEVEVNLDSGRAVYASNLTISEKNGLDVKVVVPPDNKCYLSN